MQEQPKEMLTPSISTDVALAELLLCSGLSFFLLLYLGNLCCMRESSGRQGLSLKQETVLKHQRHNDKHQV